jgi:hypothetical protein
MSIGRFILLALLIWFLYNLIFRFIVPIFRTTRQVKQKFREMREQMDQHQRKQEGFDHKSPPNTQKTQPQKPEGDYIDFEEIK